MKAIQSVGVKYGRITVLKIIGIETGSSIVEGVCECGKSWTGRLNGLRSGMIRSCGCLKSEEARKPKTHGMTTGGKSPEYRIWASMIQRCYNPKRDYYHCYGGRGITVCDRWRYSFENFFEDMGKRPSSKHSIDRINNDKSYSPENCQWSTAKEQGRNTRTTRLVEFEGEMVSLQSVSEKHGIPYGTMRHRLAKGMSVANAISYKRFSRENKP